MKKIILYFIMLIICSCSKNDDDISLVNSNPGELKLEEISFQGNVVTLNWNDVIDLDEDIIYYSLYINSILIEKTTLSTSTLPLEYNNKYDGKIIATDKNGGVSELDFSIESPKSKILFFSDVSGKLIAHDLITNKTLWESDTYIREAHTTYKNMIFSGVDGLNGINILTGELEWTSSPSNNYNYYKNIITDNINVYAFNDVSDLQCVNIETGEKLWDRSFLDYNATLSIDETRIFVSSRNDDHLFAINKVTGGTDWSLSLDASNKFYTNPLINNDNIYIGDSYGVFYAINRNNGNKIWTIDLGRYNTFIVSPTIFENTIITGTYNTLYSLHENNGSIKWTYSPEGTIQTSPFIYNNSIYIGYSNNGTAELICLNAENGNLKWKYDLSSNTTTSPIVYEDTVYMGDWGNNFYAINSNTGELEWKIQRANSIISSPTIVIGNSDTVIYPSSHGLKN
ncbi:PQQ-binding-like beta-propeller repeat protein [Polaribacter sargassicola]|uniref:PQQ-binding-like beta-propeller repeat protein n=1 Tax=Polaribacter sargassicola TaxID=2836891 RepID=UPI001F227592|nr:PQQ-binding-like beta-propeller repeat protein [Polaribacter sp. DS7-9]MCG1037007.1 PQQ-binding-like beta-propeller repeat protein [Polaribacter sp. DS7-9]